MEEPEAQGRSKLSQALRLLADRCPSARDAQSLRAMADQLDDILERTARHADAPSRTDMAAALGNAELGIANQLDQLLNQYDNHEQRITVLERQAGDKPNNDG
jgi:hypothetical protein